MPQEWLLHGYYLDYDNRFPEEQGVALDKSVETLHATSLRSTMEERIDDISPENRTISITPLAAKRHCESFAVLSERKYRVSSHHL